MYINFLKMKGKEYLQPQEQLQWDRREMLALQQNFIILGTPGSFLPHHLIPAGIPAGQVSLGIRLCNVHKKHRFFVSF